MFNSVCKPFRLGNPSIVQDLLAMIGDIKKLDVQENINKS